MKASICPDGLSWLGILIPKTLFKDGKIMDNKENRSIKKSFRFTQQEWSLIENKYEAAEYGVLNHTSCV